MSTSHLPKTAPTIFVHFKNPETGERVYSTRTTEIDGAPKTEKVRVGVWVYTPGSKIYRTADNMNTTANIRAGKKELTGAKLFEQQTDLLARTTFKLEGFDIDGSAAPGFESLKAFYDAEENVAIREQVQEEQADLGKSSTVIAKA